MRKAQLKLLSSMLVLVVFLIGTTALLVILVTAHAYAPHPRTVVTGSGICLPALDCLHNDLRTQLGK